MDNNKKVATFSERLAEGMRIRGLNGVKLSDRSGVASSEISHYKNGHYEAKQENLERLAKALNVSIAWLMGYDVPISAAPKTDLDKVRFYDDNEEFMLIYGDATPEEKELFTNIIKTVRESHKQD